MVGENRIEPLEAFGLKVISVGFLNPGDKPIIWRGPMLHQIVTQFLGMVEWGILDYMIVDLPPGTGDMASSLVQTVPLTGAVVVTDPRDVSLQDARKAIEMFRTMKVDIIGVVENMSYFVCPHCHQEIDVFSRVAGSAPPASSDCRSWAASSSTPASARSGTTAIRWCWRARIHHMPDPSMSSPAKSRTAWRRSRPAHRPA